MTQLARTAPLPLQVKYMPSADFACIRLVGPYVMSSHAAWQRLFDWMTRRGHNPKIGCRYGLAHDDPSSADHSQLRYDACVRVPETWQPVDGSIAWRQKFRGGAYALHRVVGPYATLAGAICEVRNVWMPRDGWSIDKERPLVTVYYDDPLTTPPELQTADIGIPIDVAAGNVPSRAA